MQWKKVSPELSALLAEAVEPFPAQKRTMFGCPACMVNDNMFAGVHQDSGFIRLSEADRDDYMMTQKGAVPFEPMPGRKMREYVVLTHDILGDRGRLEHWLGRAYGFALSLPPKERRAARRKKRTLD